MGNTGAGIGDVKTDHDSNSSANPRLYPSKLSSRFYPLTLLRNAMEFITNKYLSHHNGLVLVDYGCGTMPYRPLFGKYVARYVGVDVPGHGADAFIQADGKTDLPDSFADAVVSTQVLEHVEYPGIYLEECRRILKPDGLLILSTHGFWMYHPDPVDLWRWTGEGLQRILREAGFHVIEIQGLMGLASTAIHLLQDALAPRIPRLVRPLFVLMMQALVITTDHIHSPSKRTHDACIFVVIARKA
jgi:SAM-dependent methyltransferase